MYFATTMFSALTQPLRGRLCVVVTNDGANHGADIETSAWVEPVNLAKLYCSSPEGSHNGSAAVLKTAVRKDMQVRVLSPPPILFNDLPAVTLSFSQFSVETVASTGSSTGSRSALNRFLPRVFLSKDCCQSPSREHLSQNTADLRVTV